MATSVPFSGMASGGFVLKSVRNGTLTTTAETFSVQNEGDFCVIVNELSNNSDYEIAISQIDDITVNIVTHQSNLIFGKNIVAGARRYNTNYHIYEYGPAE